MTVDELEQRMTVTELVDHAADFRLLGQERKAVAEKAKHQRGRGL
jgi:hypothetical protein